MKNIFFKLFPDPEAAPIADLAHGIRADYPRHRICGIGESPAWLVQAVKIEDGLTGRLTQAFSIPFSGKYCLRIASNAKVLAFQRTVFPKVERVMWYRALLTRLGVSPLQIVETFEKDETKTLFFDIACTGTSLASFFSFLYPWAKSEKIEKRFAQATELLMVASSSRAQHGPMTMVQEFCTHPVDVTTVYEGTLFSLLAKEEKLGRLVPSCKSDEWEGPIELTRPLSFSAKWRLSSLRAYIQKNYVPRKVKGATP